MKYTVHMLTPYLSWDGIEANSEEEAKKLAQAGDPAVQMFDWNEGPVVFLAVEEVDTLKEEVEDDG
jgi:hypothetical protein